MQTARAAIVELNGRDPGRVRERESEKRIKEGGGSTCNEGENKRCLSFLLGFFFLMDST